MMAAKNEGIDIPKEEKTSKNLSNGLSLYKAAGIPSKIPKTIAKRIDAPASNKVFGKASEIMD